MNMKVDGHVGRVQLKKVLINCVKEDMAAQI